MIYTPLTKKALRISFEAHKNQIDKAGLPYVYHPYEVASRMDDEYSTAAALLHDTIEDTKITRKDLEREGIPDEVITAVVLLTRSKDVPYLEYVRRIRTDETARKVKTADLMHNMDTTRLDEVDEKAQARLALYKEALEILTR